MSEKKLPRIVSTGGVGYGTKVYGADGNEFTGVVSIEISPITGPDDVIRATVVTSPTILDIEVSELTIVTEPVLSLGSLIKAAKFHNLVLVRPESCTGKLAT